MDCTYFFFNAGVGYAVIDLKLFTCSSSYLHTKRWSILTTLSMDRSSIWKQNLMHSGETSGALSGCENEFTNIHVRCVIAMGRVNEFGSFNGSYSFVVMVKQFNCLPKDAVTPQETWIVRRTTVRNSDIVLVDFINVSLYIACRITEREDF
jgi:hypothetical protein